MSGTEIRATLPSDFDALASVLVQVHASDGYPVEGLADPRAWITLPDALGQWTALLDGAPVGHVALVNPALGGEVLSLLRRNGLGQGQVAEVVRLFVAPVGRGRGLASALMDMAEKAAKNLNLYPALEVMVKDAEALQLYESRGWLTIGSVRHRYGEGLEQAALVLAKAPNSRPNGPSAERSSAVGGL